MPTTNGARPLRRDAAANRRRILEAAGDLMAARGLNVPIEDIAAAAEVGIGTVYRRFATREELVAAIFEARLDAFAADIEASFTIEDGWEAFVWFLRQTTARRVADRALSELLEHDTATVRRVRERLDSLSTRMVERALGSGKLRADFEPGDLVLLQHMLAGLGALTAPLGPEVWERYLGLVLDALASSRDHPTALTPPAPSLAQLEVLFGPGGLDAPVCPAGQGAP